MRSDGLHPPRPGRPWGTFLGIALVLVEASASSSPGQDEPGAAPEKAADPRELLATGKYAECIAAATQALAADASDEEVRLLALRAQLAVGDHAGAIATLEAGLKALPWSLQLRWEGRSAYLRGGKPDLAVATLESIEELLRRSARAFRDPADQVIIGRYLLHAGADARDVLEGIYDRLLRDRPDCLEARIASADLALAKHDAGVAVSELERALKLAPGDPDVLVRLARARAESDAAAAEKHALAALERNPRHVDGLLFLAGGAIDGEAYDAARELIDRALAVDATHPEALAHRAVLAHLAGDFEGEKAARAAALATWTSNPLVDHTIGRKLSQKYRFAEGAEAQRRALAMDPRHLEARTQLCQDLLRLGEEEEGWRLAREVFREDGYNVVAHNLDILHGHVASFRTLAGGGIVLRMEPREASIYGERAHELLRRARETLCARYDVVLDADVTVEVFPEQKDFAIRTFGLPGGAGFLGVCFGKVITANSPASQGEDPSCWEAVLWHELCHAVTLEKTRNRMPRWLSEGISVHEERRANPAWGQTMTPAYLELIESGGLTPVSELSGAFLHPRSPLHLQFAYYESSLVVELIVERRGLDALKRLLDALGRGVPALRALEGEVGPLADFDREAEGYVRGIAAQLAARAEWTRPEVQPGEGLEALGAWTREHPRSFPGLQLEAIALLAERRWDEARERIDRLTALHPTHSGPDSPWLLLARLERELAQPAAERAALEKAAALDADLVSANLRLVELCEQAQDWQGAAAAADRLIAVSPLIPEPHRALASAAEELGEAPRAIRACRSLLAMDPVDPAGLHYQLGRLLREAGDLRGARRQIVLALEAAPRFLAAYRELLAVVRELERREAEKAAGGEKEREL